ncbi:putative short-chain dehydrogenase [Amylocarpus encephaloides]|uniref:Short-chain dehydrogenase n=1 Tax=Amylocarpus encephaloides TaxID=45428 RepID=A0A9P7YJK7_9HELO|nr:putative short-chain dehydrogenase [Amylocarpus encephaloides]
MAKISTLSAFFPPPPTFTDKNLPSLIGKVYIVTGGASGVGHEVVKMLYRAGGTVYIAARSEKRCQGAIDKMKGEFAKTFEKVEGQLKSMVIDLSDLRTIKPAAEKFLSDTDRLDVLVHNAAVMTPPSGSKDALGHDLEMGTNCLGPYLLTLLLESLLINTAVTPNTPVSTVRIVWVTSLLQANSREGGVNFDKNGTPVILTKGMDNYMQSKAGCAWLAHKFSERLGSKGILSVCIHPGLMRTELQRHWPLPLRLIMSIMFKGPEYGAYSEIYAAFSPDITQNHNGGYLTAWGRIGEMPTQIMNGLKRDSQGNRKVDTFFDYCDRQITAYR